MRLIRKSQDRGVGFFGWLLAKYTFSFSRYFDAKWTGFGPLLVMNEDRVSAKSGFPFHGHKDMEIITYVLSGELTHEDDLGHKKVLIPGQVQVMSAGTGVTHSEWNHGTKNVHLYQIWIKPRETGLRPKYQQQDFSQALLQGLCLVASPDARQNSLEIRQEVEVYIGHTQDDLIIEKGWVQVIKGQALVDSQVLESGDGIAVKDVAHLSFLEKSHIIYFKFLD